MKYNMATIKRTSNEDLKNEMYKRYFMKGFKKQTPKKPVKSMQEDWHYVTTDKKYGETWAEIGFFEAEGMTDEEIQEYVDEMKMYVTSPYDCSGQVFTWLISWHRNPCGWISVVHRKAIDC